MNSIATKFLLPLGALLLVFLLLAVCLSYTTVHKQTTHLLDRQTAMALEFEMAIREYVAEEIRPVMEQHIQPGEFHPETMSTSYVARSIFSKVQEEFPDYILKFSADDPRNPANRAGPGESEMVRFFNENPDVQQWNGEIQINGQPHLARFNARRMKDTCLRCHGEPSDAPASLIERYGDTAGFHRSVGEVIALDTVAIPLQTTQASIIIGTFRLAGLIAGGFLLFGVLIAFIFRVSVLKRMTSMRSHFEQIANHPDASTMLHIPVTGNDDISAMAHGFNAMIDRVHEAQTSLEERVADQTSHLREAKDEADNHARRAELALTEMGRIHRVMIGREQRILEMKKEVNELLSHMDRVPKYEHI